MRGSMVSGTAAGCSAGETLPMRERACVQSSRVSSLGLPSITRFHCAMPSLTPQLVAVLQANLSSIPFDFCARQKVGGLHLTYFTMRQLPALRPMVLQHACTLGAGDENS